MTKHVGLVVQRSGVQIPGCATIIVRCKNVQEQDVYTVNYGTQNLLSSGGKATSYILGLCVHYLVLVCSYL